MQGLRAGVVILALAAGPAAARSEAPSDALAPYQLMRSLQLVQDEIANGDHAALPMQQRLLRMIDQRLANSDPADFVDGRNFRALMLYAMCGGNPRTVERLAGHLLLDDTDAKLSAGLLQYIRGNLGGAVSALASIEPSEVSPDLSPFVALVKGTVYAAKEPEKSLGLLDQARLLGPGTLIEEAALRRSMTLATQLKRADRFLSASDQYVRRFLRSPYASQFADAFVEGVAALHEAIDRPQVAGIIAAMTPEQSKVIYLRIARRAAIDRTQELLSFATDGIEAGASDQPDPRSELYRALAEVASADPAVVQTRLGGIDRRQLSGADRLLLDAALAVASDVGKPVVVEQAPQPEAADYEAASETVDETDYAEQPLNEEIPASTPVATASAPQGGDATAEDAFVARTRERLAVIDEILKETSR